MSSHLAKSTSQLYREFRADQTIISNEMKVYPIMNRAKRAALRTNKKSVKIEVTPY